MLNCIESNMIRIPSSSKSQKGEHFENHNCIESKMCKAIYDTEFNILYDVVKILKIKITLRDIEEYNEFSLHHQVKRVNILRFRIVLKTMCVQGKHLLSDTNLILDIWIYIRYLIVVKNQNHPQVKIFEAICAARLLRWMSEQNIVKAKDIKVKGSLFIFKAAKMSHILKNTKMHQIKMYTTEKICTYKNMKCIKNKGRLTGYRKLFIFKEETDSKSHMKM